MKIVKIFSILFLVVIMSSCGTLLGSKQHFVSFTSTPTKANIYIDDNKKGTTPTKIALTPNKNYTVTYKKEGYKDVATQLTHTVSGQWLLLDFFVFPIGHLIDVLTNKWKEFNQELIHQNLEVLDSTYSSAVLKKDSLFKNEEVVKLKKSNEIRINVALYTAVFDRDYRFYSFDYQRILDDKRSIGFSLGGRFKFNSVYETFSDFPSFPPAPDIAFLPYYREYYFSNKRASGVFSEIHGFFSYYKHRSTLDGVDKGNQNPWGFGIGSAVGYKYLSKDNWIFELLLGGGFNTQYLVHLRAGILIGKRF